MSQNTPPKKTPLQETLTALKQHIVYVGCFSAAVNLLMLVPIIYMMQIYDRVVSSGSLSTLGMLTIIMIFLLVASGGFEWVRSMIMINASGRLDRMFRDRVYNATFKQALLTGGVPGTLPNNDLSALRQFLTGSGLFAFFDAPWYPIYVGFMFIFHPWFGVIGIIAGVVMVSLAYVTEKVTNEKLQDANAEANWVTSQIGGSIRNAEVIAAMGMNDSLRQRQQKRSDKVLGLQNNASRSAGLLGNLSKSLRLIMQSSTLGVGAYLAIHQEISPGMMIGGSLLLGRALAPIDTLVGNWKGFSVARSQYSRLKELLASTPEDAEKMELPDPQGQLSLEQVAVVPPGARAPVVRGVTLALAAGESLGIIGPSASGKSSLARSILGIWPAAGGKVRLDGSDIAQWDRVKLGPFVGYLPQDIELFDGSISENICRFGEMNPEKIVAAAKLAGVHDLVQRLPQGYDTIIGGHGGILSGGQRQRIGLARAVYGDPKLIVLDEPNSNLDDQGEKELVAALARIKATGCTVVVITHRTMLLMAVDKVLVMKEGQMANFGPRDKILAGLIAPQDARKSAQG